MDQHKELVVEGEPADQRKEEDVAGKPQEPTDQRKEEEEAGKPEEPADLRKVEVEAVAEVDTSEEPTDQRKEEEEREVDKPEEPTDQRKEEEEPEVDKPEDRTDQRKEAAEEKKDKETERSSDEVSVFVHPCSLLLRYLVRAYAWCQLALADYFGGGTRPSACPAASTNSSREEAGEAADISTREISKTTSDRGFYMREVSMRVRAGSRPPPPDQKPREGHGGGGGSHN